MAGSGFGEALQQTLAEAWQRLNSRKPMGHFGREASLAFAQARAAMTEMAIRIYDVLMTLMTRLGSLRQSASAAER